MRGEQDARSGADGCDGRMTRWWWEEAGNGDVVGAGSDEKSVSLADGGGGGELRAKTRLEPERTSCTSADCGWDVAGGEGLSE